MFCEAKTNSRKTEFEELSSEEAALISGGDCQLVSITCNYSNGVATTCEREYVCTPKTTSTPSK
jgi:hypothetical protein